MVVVAAAGDHEQKEVEAAVEVEEEAVAEAPF